MEDPVDKKRSRSCYTLFVVQICVSVITFRIPITEIQLNTKLHFSFTFFSVMDTVFIIEITEDDYCQWEM